MPNNDINSLKGPDSINTILMPTPDSSPGAGAITDPGITHELTATLIGHSTDIVFRSTHRLVSGGGAGSTTSIPCPPDPNNDPSYYFCNTISEQVLHNYLDKTIGMYGLAMYCTYYDTSPGSDPNNNTDADGNPVLPTGPGPSHNYPAYNPLSTDFMATPASVITDLNYQLGQDLAMIRDLGPKFIAETIVFWGAPPVWVYIDPTTNLSADPVDVNDNNNAIYWCCNSAKYIINYVHNNIDPDIIFNAAILEQVDSNINNYMIPNYVIDEFQYELAALGISIAYGSRFDYSKMLYQPPPPIPPPPPGPPPGYPYSLLGTELGTMIGTVNLYNHVDITQIMTRMWFYFLATQYINAGIESLHFGDVFTTDLLDRNGISYFPEYPFREIIYDIGHYYYWDLLTRVRGYAAIHARRGVVICGATAEEDFYYDPQPGYTTFGASPVFPPSPPQFPVAFNILPNWQRQLVFDYHRNKIPYSAPPAPNGCNDNPIYYPTFIADTGYASYTNPIYYPMGGLHPQGWLCRQIPILLDFDNSSNGTILGCAALPPAFPEFYGDYNYDNISWFSIQNTANRNLILRYTYYRLKQLNNYSHVKMLGGQHITGAFVSDNRNDVNCYRANSGPYVLQPDGTFKIIPKNLPGLTGFFNQQPTIKALWNGVFSQPADWIPHNFTAENVTNGPDIYPVSSLIISGTNSMFYIGTDNYIHGYINVNPGYNSGTWAIVSPSYSAQIFYGQAVSDQVMAKSDLVASPDGTLLLYIGQDNNIHGFNAIDEWTYNYFDFIISGFAASGIKFYANLIFPKNDRIYFVGIDRFDTKYLVGGIKDSSGTWNFINVSNIASGTGQIRPAGSLNYNIRTDNDMIYYIGIDGYIYNYLVIDPNTYIFIFPFEIYNILNSYGLSLVTINGPVTNLAIYYNSENNNTWIYFVGYMAYATPGFTNYNLCCISEFSSGVNFTNFNDYTIPNYIIAEYNNYGNPPYTFDNYACSVAVSPDGSTIIYFTWGDTFNLSMYYYDGLNYYFKTIHNADVNLFSNSLQFLDNDTIFYINNYYGDVGVQLIKMEEPKNSNPCLNDWPL